MRTIDITALAAADARHGGKAQGLAALLAAGLPVPPGVVFDARSTPIADLAKGAVQAAREHGWTGVAIRSSGRDEDGSETSSAGAYRTVLGVAGADADAVENAIEAVVVSMGEARAGVVVQRMVRADAAGVVFTADPVTGAPSIVVDAVPGLGDVLVSGAVTPWELRIPRDGWRTAAVADDRCPVDGDVLHEVVRLALAAEEARGAPQDVEWAVEDGVVWLVQSRPVTALPLQVPVDVVVPAGFWARDPSHGRLPRTAMLRSIVDEAAAFGPATRRFGVLVDFISAEIGGWTYMGIQPVGAPPPRPGVQPKAPPAWLVSALLRVHPEGRRRLRAARKAYRTDAAADVLREWRDVQAPHLRGEILGFQSVDLGGLDDVGVADELERRSRLIRGSAQTHFMIGMPYGLGLLPLIDLCRRHLRWTADQAMDLLSGLASVASEPARELAALAALPADSHERAAALERFQRFYGCRALDIEISEPTLAESPGILSAMIDAAAAASKRADAVSAERAARIGEARALLGSEHVAEFDAALARAEEVYGIRDDNVFLCIDAPLALVRYAALEGGGRLAARGALEAPEDVFHLTVEEAVAALEDGGAGDEGIREIARMRRGQWNWAAAHPGPLAYGEEPGPPPRMVGFTAAELRPTQSEMLMGEMIMSVARPLVEPRAGQLVGIAASRGTVTAPARIVHGERDFAKLRPGDILVCPSTRPSWSAIFSLLSGIVADVGGSLSHPAIIAREFGIPAVVAVGDATTAIQDGQLITVDGWAGTVTVHAAAAPRAADD